MKYAVESKVKPSKHNNLCRKQTCTVTVIYYCTEDRQ